MDPPTRTPYPDSAEESFSGEGQTPTDHFSPALPGATMITVAHQGDRKKT